MSTSQYSAGSESEPVAWQVRQHIGGNVGWMEWQDATEEHAKRVMRSRNYTLEARALYAAPLPVSVAQAEKVPDGYRAAWLEMIEHCNTIKADRFRLEQTIRDSIEALERNSTSAPVVECLKAALPSTDREGGK